MGHRHCRRRVESRRWAAHIVVGCHAAAFASSSSSCSVGSPRWAAHAVVGCPTVEFAPLRLRRPGRWVAHVVVGSPAAAFVSFCRRVVSDVSVGRRSSPRRRVWCRTSVLGFHVVVGRPAAVFGPPSSWGVGPRRLSWCRKSELDCPCRCGLPYCGVHLLVVVVVSNIRAGPPMS